MLEHLGDVRAVDARGREIFLHEARQQIRIAAAFGLEDLEHDLLLVGHALAQADIGGGAAAERLDRREALDAGGLEHGLGVGQAPGFGARDHARAVDRRLGLRRRLVLGACGIGLMSAAAGRLSDLRGASGGALTSISAGGLWRDGFGQHAHDLREVRLGAQLRQPQQAFLAQVLVVDEQVRVAVPAEIRRRFAVGGEVVHFQLGGRATWRWRGAAPG